MSHARRHAIDHSGPALLGKEATRYTPVRHVNAQGGQPA